MKKQRKESTDVLKDSAALENDVCYGKHHSYTHITCIHCAVSKQCGTATGRARHVVYMTETPRDGKNHMDLQMHIGFENIKDRVSPTGILEASYFAEAEQAIKDAEASGNPITVKETRGILKDTLGREPSTLETIFWVHQLVQRGKVRLVEDSLICA